MINAPTYSPYSSSIPSIGTKPNEENRNALWRSWGCPAGILGSLLLLMGLIMIPLELSRIIRGSLNRGDQNSYLLYPNYNADRNQLDSQFINFMPDILTGPDSIHRLDNKGVVPYSAIQDPPGPANNYPIQDKYLWPWSHAALLFLLVTLAAGGIGILSSCRRTYSSMFAFFVLALASAMLAIFLIAYYATHVHWQLNKNGNRRKQFYASKLDYRLGSTLLAFSILTFLLSLLSAIYTGLSLGICCGSKVPKTGYQLLAQPQVETKVIPVPVAVPTPVPTPVPINIGRRSVFMPPSGPIPGPIPRFP